MALALNIISLVLVLGICWLAMMWYTRHSKSHVNLFEAEVQRDRVTPAGATPAASGELCEACEGLGAKSVRGSITPCPACLGTGEAT